MSQVKTASVDMFINPHARLLGGQYLSDVKSIQLSISRYGLLSPIVVARRNKKLFVIDGRKRLAALRRLDFLGRLPRSLVNIPYVELSVLKDTPSPTPRLMSNRDLLNIILRRVREVKDIDLVAKDLFLTRKFVREILTLTRLSPRLKKAFYSGSISFEQARSYAATPLHGLQDRAFMSLGPFVEASEILDYLNAQNRHVPAKPVCKPRIAAKAA